MKKLNRNHGYSADLVNDYLSADKPIISLSTETETQYIWKNNKPTKQIKGYRAWFSQQGVDPFQVRFDTNPKLPQYLSEVTFKELKAVEVQNNVYFKASDLDEA